MPLGVNANRQFATIQPNPTAGWAIINFDPLSFGHKQINVGAYRTFHVSTPSWLLAVVTLQRQHQVTESWLTHHLAKEYNPTTSNTEICLITIISLGAPNLAAANELGTVGRVAKQEGL